MPPLLDRMRRMPRAGDTAFDIFEAVVLQVLTLAIVLLVLLASTHLVVAVVRLLLDDAVAPASPVMFQGVFGMVFTVVIGLEFKHSLVISSRHGSVVRARSIILIGMLATVRKFIVLDLATVRPAEMAAISGAILALGVVYWLVRDQDRRLASRE